MRLRSTAVAALILTLILGAVAYAGIQSRPEPRAAAPTFRVRGHVTGLYPGIKSTYRAKVKNPLDRAIVVRRVTARVTSPSPSCPSSSVKVKQWHGKLTVKPHRTKRVRLTVRMRPTSPDGCQGIRFQIRYAGQAR